MAGGDRPLTAGSMGELLASRHLKLQIPTLFPDPLPPPSALTAVRCLKPLSSATTRDEIEMGI